jgi:hypothetical protein
MRGVTALSRMSYRVLRFDAELILRDLAQAVGQIRVSFAPP